MYNNDSALIKTPLEIYNLLKNIHKSKQLITLSFKSLPQHCLTSLLEVQHDTQELIFDEPNPMLSSKILSTKDVAEFSLKLEHLPIKFKATLIKNGSRFLHTHFPDEIYYPQNRTFYRFRTEFIENIKITIFLTSTKQITCQLVNISLNGLCLRVPISLVHMFQPEQLIDDIYVELPGQKAFSISTKVKNTRVEKNHESIIVGLEMLQQKSIIEKTIQQFIFRAKKNVHHK